MKLCQAVRLRELWNKSFGLNLRTREEKLDECTLYVLKTEISVACFIILQDLVNRMDFELKEKSRMAAYFTFASTLILPLSFILLVLFHVL